MIVTSRSTETLPVDKPIYPTVELPFNETSFPCEFEDWPMNSMLHFLVIGDSVNKSVDHSVTTQYHIDDDRRLLLEEGEMWYAHVVDPSTYTIVREKFNEMTIPDNI